jgi:hypothetical protein
VACISSDEVSNCLSNSPGDGTLGLSTSMTELCTRPCICIGIEGPHTFPLPPAVCTSLNGLSNLCSGLGSSLGAGLGRTPVWLLCVVVFVFLTWHLRQPPSIVSISISSPSPHAIATETITHHAAPAGLGVGLTFSAPTIQAFCFPPRNLFTVSFELATSRATTAGFSGGRLRILIPISSLASARYFDIEGRRSMSASSRRNGQRPARLA